MSDMCATDHLCPYCEERPKNSDDHIFPAFLGGETTIRACKSCNDMFGHTFEGSVSNDLAPTAVMLRRAGLHAPRRMVWRRALKREGRDYDLDTNLKLTPSVPFIERDSDGTIANAIFPNRQSAKGFIRGQEAEGKKIKMDSRTVEGIDIRRLDFRIRVGMELRRLAVKMAIATADLMGFKTNFVDNASRNFLLGRGETTQQARVDFVVHSALENLRPPLSHCVFVKGNAQTKKCYAVVQFYGLVQLYVMLNNGGFAGSDFAVLALLDIAQKYAERFEKTEPLMIPEALGRLGHWKSLELKMKWLDKFNLEAKAVLQDDAKLITLHTV